VQVARDDRAIRDQIAFYRGRAPDYPAEAESGTSAYDESVLALCPRSAHCLELASGTGRWTKQLLRVCDRLTAVDASQEMHERNRRWSGDERVEYVVADIFEHQPRAKHDLVFAGFWLSHVPASRFGSFWAMVGQALAPDGCVVMVDDGVRDAQGVARFASDPSGSDASRRLPDGREFTIVKVAYAPDELQAGLAAEGWDARVTLLSPVSYVLEARPFALRDPG
jgi:SAM-dependent methyltransferase